MFLAGTAQGPKSIPDSIAQAKAAAARAISMLSTGFVADAGPGRLERRGRLRRLRRLRDGLPAGRRHAHDGRRRALEVDPNICRGCGICAAECPTGAMQLGGFSDDEVLAEATV